MSQRTISRRAFLRWSALGAGAVVAACTAPAASTPEEAAGTGAEPAGEAATITWWHEWGGTTGMAALTAVEEAFNAQSDGLQVERLQVPEMEDKLLTAIAGGTPPDVGVCCVSYAQLYARDVVLPLDDYIAASEVVNPEDFISGLFESMTWQGRIYGVPALECGPRYGMMYNVQQVTEAGLEPPAPDAPPMTWDEAYQWHEAITQLDDAGNLVRLGFDPLESTAFNGPRTNIAMFWGVDYGLDTWDQATMTFHFDDDRFIQALQTIKRFYDLVGVEKMADIRTNFGGGTQSPSGRFPAGQEAMLMTGYYSPGELATSAPDTEFGVMWAPVPSERAGTRLQNVGGHPAYVPKGSANPEATFRFIEFLTNDTTAEIMFDTTGWLPGRSAFYDPESERANKYPNLSWYLRSALEADEFWAGPVIPIDGFVNQEKARTYDAVVYGEKTPEQAALDMQAACTDELSDQFPDLAGG